MPIYFPALDHDGKPIQVRYFTVDESAPKLHVGRMTIRENCRRGKWPHLKVGGRYFLSDEHLARIIEMNTVNPDLISEAEWAKMAPKPDRPRPRLVTDPDEAEGGVK